MQLFLPLVIPEYKFSLKRSKLGALESFLVQGNL